MERTEAPTSKRVRELLATRGISEAALARELGFSQSYVSRRMRGDVPWRVDDLGVIANFLDLPVARLLDEDVAA